MRNNRGGGGGTKSKKGEMMKRKIFSVLFALVLVLTLGLVTAVPAAAQLADGDVTIVVQIGGSPIEGASARLLFYGGGKGGYNMEGKSTDANGSATFTAAEIAAWLTAEGYDHSSQIYAQPGAKVETETAYGKVRTVDPEDGFPCIPYNVPGASLVPVSAMSFTYDMILMSTEPVQTVWDDPSNEFTVTATLAAPLSVVPDETQMRLIRNLVGGQPPAAGGSDDDWYMWNGTAYERWKGIATVEATATSTSISASFSQDIFSDWLVGNKTVVRPEFGVGRTVDGVPCIDDYSAVDILRPSSYIHPAQINDTDLFYPTIQDAIAATGTGDTVNVAAGTYNESLNIDVLNLTLQSTDGADSTTINAQEASVAIWIAGMLGDVTIDGFWVENWKNGGIIMTSHPGGVGTYPHILNNTVIAPTISESHGVSIQVSGDGATVIGNTVTVSNLESEEWAACGICVAAATDRGASIEGVVIRDNYVNNNGFGIGIATSGEGEWAVNDTLIEDNTVEGCGTGIQLEENSQGTLVQNNTIRNNKKGIQEYVEGGYIPSTEAHYNNIYGNSDYGARVYVEDDTDISGHVFDAAYNYWGSASGPIPPETYESYGDKVGANVEYEPWLLEEVDIEDPAPTIYEKTLALKDGWTLISVDKAVASSTWVGKTELSPETTVVALKYTPTGGFVDATLADLQPVNALYVKTDGGGGVGINYPADADPVVNSKDLEAGWNLISIPSINADTRAILSPLRYVQVGEQQGVGLATLVSQEKYNQYSDSFYQATLTNEDWDDLEETLEPFDGYWAYMNAAKTFVVIP